jgi:molybdate transport system substrate-binding protein
MLLLTGACGHPAAAPLRIAAASDLQSALPRVTDRFQSRTGITTSVTFGASGQLAEQIKQGAPFDILLSANEAYVRDLDGEGFITPGSFSPYARGSLVLAIFAELEGTVRSLDDLAKPEVKKIALANPATAPYGTAGKQALERAGLWKKIESKIVVAESVRQALLYAQKGDAEAALVGRAIAGVPEVRMVDIDPRLYDPIVQALGVVKASTRTADAQRFARFVLEDEGQSILRQFGFTPPRNELPSQPEQASRTLSQPSSSRP